MSEMVIKRHSFDIAKNRLKEFSEKTEAELQIEKVKTDGGFFGLGDHKVTGDEFNIRLESIQGHFIAVNTTSNKVIKEFREVYNALDALDKDYITSIVANVKAIEKTSNDVRVQQGTLKKHNEELANQQSKLDAHQDEIEKNVENILKIVETLKVFKEKLEGYKHLTDIDKIWNDINVANENFSTVEKSFIRIDADILEMQEQIAKIESFIAFINGFVHLQDIDKMWGDLAVVKTNITKINEVIKDNNENIQIHKKELNTFATTIAESKESIDTLFEKLSEAEEYAVNSRNFINELKGYKEKLKNISHLEDVDTIWQHVEEHTTQFTESGKRDEELATAIQNNKDEVDKKIADAVQTATIAVESLTKRVKYAYWIAGGSAGLAIIEFVLLLMKVI